MDSGRAEQRPHGILHHYHHVEQRVAVRAALDLQIPNQRVERIALVLLCLEHCDANAIQQFR